MCKKCKILAKKALYPFLNTFICPKIDFTVESAYINVQIVRSIIDLLRKPSSVGQLRWTYLDDAGQHYNVGIYHGDNTGHIMLYVNSNIVLIDFSVKESKHYSLYLGEELCDVIVEKKNGNFAYGLKPNMDVDTSLNRKRRKENIKNNLKTAFLGFLLIVLIVSINIALSTN